MSGAIDNLLDVFKEKARQVGSAAGVASTKAKLRLDVTFLERDIKNRQHKFGIQLYDYVSVWSARPDFFAANEDNILIATLRPPLIQSQREIAALHLKRTNLKEKINVTTASKTAAFNQKSEHWTETVQSVGKTTMFAGSEARLKTELALVEREINQYKHSFGVTVYQQFALLEDTKQWLPTDREIRSLYDSCRKDIDSYKNRISAKEQEIRALDKKDGSTNASTVAYEGSTPTPGNKIIDAHHQQNAQTYGNNQSDPFSSSAPPTFINFSSSTQPTQQTQSPLHASDAGLFRYSAQDPSPQQRSGQGGFDDIF